MIKDLRFIFLSIGLLLFSDSSIYHHLNHYLFVKLVRKIFLKRIIVPSKSAIDIIQKSKIIAFNKTGIITERNPTVLEIISFKNQSQNSKNEIISKASGLEKSNKHVLATAIIKKAKELNLDDYNFSKINHIKGVGVIGKNDSEEYAIGGVNLSSHLQIHLTPSVQKIIDQQTSEGKTVLLLINIKKGLVEGLIILNDMPKTSAKDSVNKLENLGIKSLLVTSDSAKTAQMVGSQIGIAEKDIYIGLDSTEKAKFISDLKSKHGSVIFVGDPKQDDESLKAASVGVALGVQMDVENSSYIQILEGDLTKIIDIINCSRYFQRFLLIGTWVIIIALIIIYILLIMITVYSKINIFLIPLTPIILLILKDLVESYFYKTENSLLDFIPHQKVTD